LLVTARPRPEELKIVPIVPDSPKVSGFRKFLNRFGYWLPEQEQETEDDEEELGEEFVDPFDHKLTEYEFFRDKFLPVYCGKQYERKYGNLLLR